MVPGDNLLDIFDSNPARAEDKVRDLYFRLVKFFQWRHCPQPEELAQETLRRGFGRLRRDVTIYTEDPAPYFFGIARKIVLEARKPQSIDCSVDIDDILDVAGTVDFHDTEVRICLEQCLERLTPGERQILDRYYSEEPAEVARDLGMSAGALRVKAFRAKQKLVRWIRESGATLARVK